MTSRKQAHNQTSLVLELQLALNPRYESVWWRATQRGYARISVWSWVALCGKCSYNWSVAGLVRNIFGSNSVRNLSEANSCDMGCHGLSCYFSVRLIQKVLRCPSTDVALEVINLSSRGKADSGYQFPTWHVLIDSEIAVCSCQGPRQLRVEFLEEEVCMVVWKACFRVRLATTERHS